MTNLQSAEFWISGHPAKKGSTRSFQHSKTGKIITLGADKRLEQWEATVALFAKQHWRNPSENPICVEAEFFISRPKSHFGTGKNSDKIKKCVPMYPYQGRKNDIDKMLRAILDGLTGVVYLDDCQVQNVSGSKFWSRKESTGCNISVWEIEDK